MPAEMQKLEVENLPFDQFGYKGLSKAAAAASAAGNKGANTTRGTSHNKNKLQVRTLNANERSME